VLQGQRVATVGGGNVAMDAVRTAKRLGAQSSMIVYRRTRKEMPARAEEIHHAEEENIQFELLTAPVEVLGNDQNWVTGLKCVRMQLGEPTLGPGPANRDPGSEFVLPATSWWWRSARGPTRCSQRLAPSSSSTSGATS